jgi:hypothetical protein
MLSLRVLSHAGVCFESAGLFSTSKTNRWPLTPLSSVARPAVNSALKLRLAQGRHDRADRAMADAGLMSAGVELASPLEAMRQFASDPACQA